MAKPIVASGAITIIDLNDAITAGEAPASPSEGTLWINTNETPNVLYIWDGNAWVKQHLSIGDLDPDFANQLENLKDQLGNIANDGVLSDAEKLNIKLLLVEITGQSVTGEELPTLAEIDNKAGGQVYMARMCAQKATVSTNHESYIAFEAAYNSLKAYLETLSPRPWLDGSTLIDPSEWLPPWNTYYETLAKLQVVTKEFLNNSLKPGEDYSGTTIQKGEGIISIRGNQLVRTILNATKCIAIQKRNSMSEQWTDMFSVDDKGVISTKGMKISNDSYVGDKTVSQLNNQVFTVIDGQLSSVITETDSHFGKNKWLVSRYSHEKLPEEEVETLTHNHIAGLRSLETVDIDDSIILNPFTDEHHIAYYYTNVYFTAPTSKGYEYQGGDNSVLYINGLEVYRQNDSASTTSITLDFMAGWNTIEIIQRQKNSGQAIRFSPAMSSTVEKMAYNISQKATSSINQLANSIELKVDADGVISAINVSPGEVKISGEKIDMQGLVSFDNMDLDFKKLFENAEGKTLILGDQIKTGTIHANDLITSGFTVKTPGNDGVVTLYISEDGTLTTRGNMYSADYNEEENTGWAITQDGIAVLNDATIRGSVMLPNSGVTNIGDNVRFWAGDSFENRETAPFRVMQDGSIFANQGTFKGTFSGRLEIGDIVIEDLDKGYILMTDNSKEREVIYIGEERIVLQPTTTFGDEDKHLRVEQGMTTVRNKDFVVTKKSGNEEHRILNVRPFEEHFIEINEHHSFSSRNNTLVINGRETQFAEDVTIEGNLTSDNHHFGNMRIEKKTDEGNCGVDFIFS